LEMSGTLVGGEEGTSNGNLLKWGDIACAAKREENFDGTALTTQKIELLRGKNLAKRGVIPKKNDSYQTKSLRTEKKWSRPLSGLETPLKELPEGGDPTI